MPHGSCYAAYWTTKGDKSVIENLQQVKLRSQWKTSLLHNMFIQRMSINGSENKKN